MASDTIEKGSAYASVQKHLFAISTAQTDFAKSSFEASKAYFEKLAGVKSPDKFVELTTECAQSAQESFVAEATKIVEADDFKQPAQHIKNYRQVGSRARFILKLPYQKSTMPPAEYNGGRHCVSKLGPKIPQHHCVSKEHAKALNPMPASVVFLNRSN